jgi:thymidine phosphorylase
VKTVGVAIAAQSAKLVPADKRIYALRDATATVESVPLIASSVMSKKLAAGADAIVLDVKAGGGALVADVRAARELATAMVEIGARLGKRTVALLTRMEEPLGQAVGDCVELVEAIATLKGEGPPDFTELCEIVAGYMLLVGGAAGSAEEGRATARRGLSGGEGLAKLAQLIEAQGGRPDALAAVEARLREAEPRPVIAAGEGYVTGIDARRVGAAVRALKEAAGSAKQLCGVILHRKTGDHVSSGEVLADVVGPASAGPAMDACGREVAAAYSVGEERVPPRGLLIEVVGA